MEPSGRSLDDSDEIVSRPLSESAGTGKRDGEARAGGASRFARCARCGRGARAVRCALCTRRPLALSSGSLDGSLAGFAGSARVSDGFTRVIGITPPASSSESLLETTACDSVEPFGGSMPARGDGTTGAETRAGATARASGSSARDTEAAPRSTTFAAASRPAETCDTPGAPETVDPADGATAIASSRKTGPRTSTSVSDTGDTTPAVSASDPALLSVPTANFGAFVRPPCALRLGGPEKPSPPTRGDLLACAPRSISLRSVP